MSANTSASADVSASGLGDTIQLGGIDWRVLDRQNGKALVVSNHILESRPYNTELINIKWESCTLRAYLNGEFYEKTFDSTEQSRILDTIVYNEDNYITNKIFLLSLEEVERYLDNKVAYDKNGNASWWWLRSPVYTSCSAANVLYDGSVYVYGFYGFFVNDVSGGVRPALWVRL